MKSLILILSLSTLPIYANTPRENAQIRIEMFLNGEIDSINEEDLQYATEEQLEKSLKSSTNHPQTAPK